MARAGILTFLAGVLALFAGGCATGQHVPVAFLAPGVSVALPAAATLPGLHREQLLTLSRNGQTHTLQTVLDADANRLTLAGLSPVGARLFRLEYTAGGIVTEQLAFISELPPATQILADIMLAYSPVKSWESNLPAGWTLVDDASSSPAPRRLLRDSSNTLVEEIFYAAPAQVPAAQAPVAGTVAVREPIRCTDKIVCATQGATDTPASREPIRIRHLRFGYEIGIQNLPLSESEP